MFKSLLFALALTTVVYTNSYSQTMNSDSLKMLAIKDAGKFKLEKERLEKFKKHRSDASSDYFKPTAAEASSSALLNDSTYVKTFRETAYKNTKKLNARGEHKRIGVLGYVAALAFVALAFIGFNQL